MTIHPTYPCGARPSFRASWATVCRWLRKLALLLVACAMGGGATIGVSSAHAQASSETVVTGRVVDGSGTGLAYANVQLAGTSEGAATDREGAFSFQTQRRGTQRLQATMVGYGTTERRITLAPGDTVRVELVLRKEIIELDEAVVSTSTFTAGNGEAVTLDLFDVVTTPGSAADIYRTIQTFPGVSSVNKGAGLYVRGGDLSETVTLVDHATVAHPYKFESPTTSLFGTVPAFLVEGVNFSAGGFSAMYGNALSGVLDMTSLGKPDAARLYSNLSLAATSLGLDVPLGDAWGLRFSGNRSFTDLLFWLNGQNNEFSLTPRSTEANLNLVYAYSDTGRFTFFNFLSTNRLGVRVDDPSFSGYYRGDTASWLHNLHWTDEVGNWTLEANAAWSRYNQQTDFATLDLTDAEGSYKGRFDAAYRFNKKARLKTGAEVEHTVNAIEGTVPGAEHDATADGVPLDERYDGTRTGGYAEIELHPLRRLIGRVGLRSDYHSLADDVVVDPRVALHYLLTEHTDVRLSWGLFHQFPAPDQFNTVTGNPALGAQRAQHWIAGVEHQRGDVLARVESYYKPYDDLLLAHPDSSINLTNNGTGTARGVDAFLKYGAFLETPIYGRLAYSYVESNRRQLRHLGTDAQFETGPAPFDVTHNLTLVANATYPGLLAGGYLSGGVTIRYATGKPHTPVVDAIPVADGAYYLPVEGPVGSDRLPDFSRVDAQVNYYLPLGDASNNVVFYVSVNNVLDRVNVLEYEYAPDYSERTEQKTNFERSFYFGVTFNYTL